MIDSFVRAASLIGLPRSIGEIYGLLYCSQAPLNFDEIEARLGLSRGSVSQGLKTLRQIGAVKLQYIPGERKDNYVPELSMERLVKGLVKDQITPHLESSEQRITQIHSEIETIADRDRRHHAAARLETLNKWLGRARKLLPVALAVLGGVQAFSKDNKASRTKVI
jgi:DNA-binding transcriptional regulator GbsR (MarR family)